MTSVTSSFEPAAVDNRGPALAVAAGVVVARIASFLAGAAVVPAVQFGLFGFAVAAVLLGRSECRNAVAGTDLRRARLAVRIGAVQLVIGAVLLVAGDQVSQIVSLGADWIG